MAAEQIRDPERIERLADQTTAAMIRDFPDLESVSFYFKRALIDTWPAAVNDWPALMSRMEAVMQQHHAQLIYMVYGDHGYADDVRGLIHDLSAQIYNKIREQPGAGQPQYNERWLECAAEKGIEPDQLKNSDYISWISERVGRKARERQAEIMGVDPDQVKPYDYEHFILGNNRRRK